ncbi:hypothetical protein V6N11_031476 [Hibiscus sabdariffa]|uniref:Uncharacterized protein n=1 Tax=Hibiscus sabdariffa TaxID=183260 RepID=A0ABR2SYI7_9ROSI
MSFPELQDPKRKYGKRYASLFDLQDKALSEAEKKKRDKAIKKSKRGGKAVDKEEVDGSSPTDSDIARMQILTSNARKAIAMGKNFRHYVYRG